MLPQICFEIINSINTSTGYSGFQLKMRQLPKIISALIDAPAESTTAELGTQEIINHIHQLQCTV